MFKKQFISFGVLIVLVIACVILIATLFIISSVSSVGNASSELGANGSGKTGENENNLPKPVVSEWELPIVISITGAESAAGLAAAWGFDYGVKTVNELGGIRELPVRITVRDAASSQSSTKYEIDTLSTDSLIIMGPQSEALFKAGTQSLSNAGMPAIGAATDASNRNVYQPFAISCITDSSVTAASVAATWVRIEQFTTVYMLYDPANSERVKNIEAALTFAGKEIIEKVEIGNEAFDASSVAEKAYSSGAEAFYVDMRGEDTLRVITQLRFIAGISASRLHILCGPEAANKELIESAKEGDMYGVQVWTTLDPGKDVEKRKAYNEAFEKNVGDPVYRDLAVDYYQSALMLKQAIETLGLTGNPKALADERLRLATWLYNTDQINTDYGDFIIQEGAKLMGAKLYTISEKGFQ